MIKNRITISKIQIDDESMSGDQNSEGSRPSQEDDNSYEDDRSLNFHGKKRKKHEADEFFAPKSINQLLAMRYPKNDFTISLPSLKAIEKAELKQQRKKMA